VQERQQDPPQTSSQGNAGKNPHFTKQHRAQVHSAPRSERGNAPEPMDVAYATAASSAAVKVDDDAILEYDSDAINFNLICH